MWRKTQDILMTEVLLVPWYILVAVGVPIVGVAMAVGRLKQKVDTLVKHDEGSDDTHDSLYSKVNKIERNLYHLMGKLDVDPID